MNLLRLVTASIPKITAIEFLNGCDMTVAVEKFIDSRWIAHLTSIFFLSIFWFQLHFASKLNTLI